MPDTRAHRGSHPEDREQFAECYVTSLQTAARELCWLLDRGYALRSSLALVGDRHALTQRQRLALARCACSQTQQIRRRAHRLGAGELKGRELWIDGYNLLISLEAALAGGVILLARDDCYRDMASLHGTYREVSETVVAAKLIGQATQNWGITNCRWYLDRPVGNSGRLKSLLLETAETCDWHWQVDLEFNPDRVLSQAAGVVVTSDSLVLDRCNAWFNAAREIITTSIAGAVVVDLSGGS